MLKKEIYPRVLIVAIGRINANDSYNNGLLLRNLFRDWPREKIAQIYSSGDNGDCGYFGSYYQIGAVDRRLGLFFYMLKKHTESQSDSECIQSPNQIVHIGIKDSFIAKVKRLFIDTGLYEIIFSPKISPKIKLWVQTFNPDIILAQGYNLSFSLLPLLLKKKTGVKLSFLTTDDWPKYLYSGQLGEPTIFRWLVRKNVKKVVNRLFSEVDVPFAFGQPMADEYALRYGKKFLTLNHVDSLLRFENAESHRVHQSYITTIIAIGNYNVYRWPLLLDVNDACHELYEQGFNVRLAILSSSIEQEGLKALSLAPYIDVFPDPGNDLLPSYLKGADILLLAEGFDEGFVSAIKLSVSSKAHLFMFSKRPIIVYAHPETGIARYAQVSGWAKLVTKRSIKELAEAIQYLLVNKKEAKTLIDRATEISLKNHTRNENCKKILHGLSFCNTDIEQSS